jgi:integrase
MKTSGATKFLNAIARNSVSTQKTYAASLLQFQFYLNTRSEKYTLDSVINPILTGKIDVYETLDEFVGFLVDMISEETHKHLTNKSINLYVGAVRSYLAYRNIDITPQKFKHKVKIPKIGREEETAIDAEDIRKILLACNNKRLKLYLLILASSGARMIEACSIRNCDIHFDVNPTSIYIRKQFTKTKVARNIYISDEANTYLKQWIKWKYRKHDQDKSDLLFIVNTDIPGSIDSLYDKLLKYFNMLLASIGLDERKEDALRRKITFNSFRRFVKTVAGDQVNTDYLEFLIGHAKSSYWTKKEVARREIYQTKVMRYVTFLDYTAIEITGKNIEARLQEKDSQISKLQEQMTALEGIMNDESAYQAHLESEITEMRKEKE